MSPTVKDGVAKFLAAVTRAHDYFRRPLIVQKLKCESDVAVES
jgi:hypothetical protein